jgi:phosphatidylserine/phosphatidylglycerophosphate/cardiolipin synthase-like enzyme
MMIKNKKHIILSIVIIITFITLFIFSIEQNKRSIKIEKIRLDNTPNEITNKSIETYFCKSTNCTQILIKNIQNSQKIHCALFHISRQNLINELNKSHIAGDEVRIIVDNENYKQVNQLPFIRHDTSSQLSHNKFCIFDNKKILTGSFNPTSWDDKNDNNIVLIESKYLAKNYKDEFNELWNSIFGKGEKVKHPIITYNNITIENYFCPEDNCEKNIIKILQTANKSIYFMTFAFTSTNIADTIIKKHIKDVEVIGVYEKSQRSIWKENNFITKKPLRIRQDNNKYNMHHKFFIIDNKTVITGSMNPTISGNKRNDENILIIHDKEISQKFIKELYNVAK